MKGLLSDTVRDIIAVVGLLLTTLQVIIALKRRNGRAVNHHSIGRVSWQTAIRARGYASHLKSSILERGKASEDDSKITVKILLVSVSIVLLGAYIATPINREADVGWVKTIALVVCGLSLFVQYCLFMYFLAVAEDMLFTEEERYGNNPKLAFSYSAFSLILLFVALAGLTHLQPEAGWIQLSLYLYSFAGLVLASLYFVVSTIMGLVDLIKSYSRR